MSIDAAFVLGITGAALILFVTERIPPDMVALLVMVSLGIGGVVDLPTLFSGLGSPVIVTFLGIFMLTGALKHTGVNAKIEQQLIKRLHLQRGGARTLTGVMTLTASVISLLMNTVASAALVTPIARRIAHQRDTSPARLLMPVSFGALLGGMATLLTTSNLLVSGLLAENGLPEFGLFSFLPVGGPIALVGIGYIALVGPLLLPERPTSDGFDTMLKMRDELVRTYRLSRRLSEAYIQPDSVSVGKTLAESDMGRRYGITISAVTRGTETFAPPDPDFCLAAGDRLLMQGRPSEIEAAAGTFHLLLNDYTKEDLKKLTNGDIELAEVTLAPRSRTAGKTLDDIHFRDRYGLNVLGIWHRGQPIRSHLAEHFLALGDALLVQGAARDIHALGQERDFLLLTQVYPTPTRTGHARMAVFILFLFLAVIGAGLLPVSLAALLAGLATVLTGCQTIEQAYTSVRLPVVFLIAGMLPLGTALERTGAIDWFAGLLLDTVGQAGPIGLLMVFFMMTALLAQISSGQAATLVIGPLAIGVALEYGINPQALAMTVGIAASAGFLSPVAHPANLLVMGPGNYQFRDYARLGLPLFFLAMAGVALLVPAVYPLR